MVGNYRYPGILMLINEPVLHRLVELYRQHELAIFLGPDLPQSLTGVPSWSDLAQRLVERAGWSPMRGWPQVAARYEQNFGRRNLIDWLDQQVSVRQAGPIYSALAALSVEKYIVATYDELLQIALRNAHRSPNVVVSDDDLSFVEPERSTVIKLLGEASAGRRDTLLLTEDDLLRLPQNRSRLLAQEVQPVFASLSLLIIGQNLRTDFFRDLYTQCSLQPLSARFRRPCFAIWSGMDDWEVQQWDARQMTILDTEPLTLVRQILEICQPG